MPTLATLIKILSTSLWAYFKSFGCFIEKNRKQVFSGHCLGSRIGRLIGGAGSQILGGQTDKMSLICLKGKSMSPHRGYTIH